MRMRHVAERAPYQLSMGERRRVAIATVLAMHPALLVLDEPSANLDPRARRELLDVLASVDRTMLVTTHDLPLAAELCERAVILAGGLVVGRRSVRGRSSPTTSCSPRTTSSCPPASTSRWSSAGRGRTHVTHGSQRPRVSAHVPHGEGGSGRHHLIFISTLQSVPMSRLSAVLCMMYPFTRTLLPCGCARMMSQTSCIFRTGSPSMEEIRSPHRRSAR